MAAVLRYAVASPRKQFNDGKSWLDLAYVTPRLIVCSMPTRDYLKTWYRLSTQDLKAFLERNHGDYWKVYNFRPEPSGAYHESDFDGKVSMFPFPDHHPPQFSMVPEFVDSLHKYLGLNDDNIAVLHCKAGQGRSGTMACAYLMTYHGYSKNEAVELFTQKRMRPGFGQGVSIMSQLRCLDYVAQWLRDGRQYNASMIVEIVDVKVYNTQYSDIQVDCSTFANEGRDISPQYTFTREDVVDEKEGFVHYQPQRQLLMPPDVQLSFNHRTKRAHRPFAVLHSTSYAWFNTVFETQPGDDCGQFVVMWEDMDGFNGTRAKGTKSFNRVAVEWKVVSQ